MIWVALYFLCGMIVTGLSIWMIQNDIDCIKDLIESFIPGTLLWPVVLVGLVIYIITTDFFIKPRKFWWHRDKNKWGILDGLLPDLL